MSLTASLSRYKLHAVISTVTLTVLFFMVLVPKTASAQTESTSPPGTPVGEQKSADIQNSLCAGANLDVTTNCQSGITGQDATSKINELIGDIINIFSLIVGVVSVIMIIVGGFRYITSGGDTNNVSAAKNTILYAIIGLIIVALAQTIVRFILGRVVET